MNAVVAPVRRRLSADEYRRMGDLGIFGQDERVELIDGEIYVMPPLGPAHSGLVTRLTHLLLHAVNDRARVQVQGPLLVSPFSEPQPDLCILRLRNDEYCRAPAEPADVLLLVEVSDSSLRFDRTTRLSMYLSSGVSEVWIVNIADRCIESYPSQHVFRLGELARTNAVAGSENPTGVSVDVSQLFAPLQSQSNSENQETQPNG